MKHEEQGGWGRIMGWSIQEGLVFGSSSLVDNFGRLWPTTLARFGQTRAAEGRITVVGIRGGPLVVGSSAGGGSCLPGRQKGAGMGVCVSLLQPFFNSPPPRTPPQLRNPLQGIHTAVASTWPPGPHRFAHVHDVSWPSGGNCSSAMSSTATCIHTGTLRGNRTCSLVRSSTAAGWMSLAPRKLPKPLAASSAVIATSQGSCFTPCAHTCTGRCGAWGKV
eukprot:351348-Chlamydomonas_euryale.AAC.3